MMYSERLVASIKANGKVLREFKDTVYCPFGQEYVILIKNLNSVRCRFNITIDGKDIADGGSFIIGANSSMELERFLRNGNMQAGNRFKFIERTAGVEAHRGGPQAEDGIIRVEFEYERENVPVPNYYSIPTPIGYPWGNYPVWPKPYYWYEQCGVGRGSSIGGSSSGVGNSALNANSSYSTSTSTGTSSVQTNSVKQDPNHVRAMGITPTANSSRELYSSSELEVINEAGITAAGSISNQQFHTVSDILGDGVKHAMIIRLLGEVGQKKVIQPVTVKAKAKCTSCGRVNKATSKFCSECATSLEIV